MFRKNNKMALYQFNSGEIKKSEFKIQTTSTFQKACLSEDNMSEASSFRNDDPLNVFFDDDDFTGPEPNHIQTEFPND